jgi:glycosyltransferase involved in cell wall biosynthesis
MLFSGYHDADHFCGLLRLGLSRRQRSVDLIPMGGTQSAVCHLLRELARLRHDVMLISSTSAPGTHHGVRCLAWPPNSEIEASLLQCDAFVCVLSAGNGAALRPALPPRVPLILWCQHDHDIRDVEDLNDPRERDAYDRFVVVSQWQLERYVRAFGIDPAWMVVARNAIAPAFEHQDLDASRIAAGKATPPILAYTSTPFRGLDLLIEAFPHIRAAVPGARLQVFSSLRVYAYSAKVDESEFGALYQRCRETRGVEYVGSIPQPQLAQALKHVAVLAYPNTFAETCCTAVLEAMASGCLVVTSELGALPETTAGFARLIPIVGRSRDDYLRQFVDETVTVLRESANPDAASESNLRRQIATMNAQHTWKVRARQWIEWLASLGVPR